MKTQFCELEGAWKVYPTIYLPTAYSIFRELCMESNLFLCSFHSSVPVLALGQIQIHVLV